MKKTLMCLTLALTANSSFAAEHTQTTSIEVVKAYEVIQTYRELRLSCAQGDYDQRRQCVSELSKTNASYRAAKDLVEITATPSKSTLVSSR